MGNIQNGAWEFIKLDFCPVCSAPTISDYYSEVRQGIPLAFSKCSKCQALFQNPRPTKECLDWFFASEAFMGKQGQSPSPQDIGYYDYGAWEYCYQKNTVPILKTIDRFKSPPAELLEIGGATGWFMHAAEKHGFRVMGVDISEKLASLVKQKYNLQVEVSSIEDVRLENGRFDVICNFGGIACWYDPPRAFAKVRDLLKSNGIFCFNYVDYLSLTAKLSGKNYFEFNHASLTIFNLASMHYLLKSSGFKILYERTQWQYASLERIFSYLKFNKLSNFLKCASLSRMVVRVPAIGSRLVVCAKCGCP